MDKEKIEKLQSVKHVNVSAGEIADVHAKIA